MQLQGTGITLSVAYPPDTETPGYAQENKVKADLCSVVNDSLGSSTFSPDTVAKGIVSQFEKGSYHLTPPDLGSTLLISMMTGLTPNVFPILIQAILSPVLQLVCGIVAMISNRAALRYNRAHPYPLGTQ